MAKLTIRQVGDRGREILRKSKTGVRWAELINQISSESPDTPVNSISVGLHALTTNEAEGITKISRGVYILKKNEDKASSTKANPDRLDEDTVKVKTPRGETTISERSFYEPLAEWLKGELGEANEAEALGGNILKGKWGTPDVLGVLKPLGSDPIKFATEIISVEIKVDPSQPIVAFGQAIAYRLFSHKSYIVMPDTITAEDLDRLEALSIIYGLGLATFTLNPKEPRFKVIIRAQSVRPDTFYMNQVAKRIREALPNIYDKMF